MNYSAINAKINAMQSRSVSASEAASRIGLYISDRDLRDFVKRTAVANGSIGYYTAQWRALAWLDKKNRQVIKPILGMEIDLTNIIWMYRLKIYLGIKGDATYGYLIPIRYRLTRATTQQMAECETSKALLEEVAKSPYAGTINFSARKITPEQQLAEMIARRYKSATKRYQNTLAPILAYLLSEIRSERH